MHGQQYIKKIMIHHCHFHRAVVFHKKKITKILHSYVYICTRFFLKINHM